MPGFVLDGGVQRHGFRPGLAVVGRFRQHQIGSLVQHVSAFPGQHVAALEIAVLIHFYSDGFGTGIQFAVLPYIAFRAFFDDDAAVGVSGTLFAVEYSYTRRGHGIQHEHRVGSGIVKRGGVYRGGRMALVPARHFDRGYLLRPRLAAVGRGPYHLVYAVGVIRARKKSLVRDRDQRVVRGSHERGDPVVFGVACRSGKYFFGIFHTSSFFIIILY